MSTTEEELQQCAARLRSIEDQMEQDGFTRKQVDLLREYLQAGMEMGMWAHHRGAEMVLKAKT